MEHIEIYADSSRGQYIPQYFAESCKRDMVTGVSVEDWAILESGPEHELYWDVWDSVLNNARITDSRGNWTLYQDGDLFLTHEDYLHDDARSDLVAAIDEMTQAQVEYEESHNDAGDNYAHMPRESWSERDNRRLAQFLIDNYISDCGLPIDTIAELALDNFTMRAEHIFMLGAKSAFILESYPLQEIEIQIEYSAIDCGFDVKRAHIEQLRNETESYIGTVSDDSLLAYMTSDVVWVAAIDAANLSVAIRDEAERLAE